jgi:hypothetical protein
MQSNLLNVSFPNYAGEANPFTDAYFQENCMLLNLKMKSSEISSLFTVAVNAISCGKIIVYLPVEALINLSRIASAKPWPSGGIAETLAKP